MCDFLTRAGRACLVWPLPDALTDAAMLFQPTGGVTRLVQVLAWRLSIMLLADFCVEAMEEALVRHGKPEVFNTDQGSQFTSTDFTKVLKTAEIAVSMDGKGAWRDSVFVERGSGGRSSTRRSICAPTSVNGECTSFGARCTRGSWTGRGSSALNDHGFLGLHLQEVD
jgi:transposase InsO family protein